MKSQNEQIKDYLKTGKSITALDALHLFGCFRLSARIQDLEDEGLIIDTKDVSVISAGKKKTFTSYKLKK
jgi:hypothetical protein